MNKPDFPIAGRPGFCYISMEGGDTVTYKKFYYRESNQKGFVELEKEENIYCIEPHEDEYYILSKDGANYIKCVCSGWQA